MAIATKNTCGCDDCFKCPYPDCIVEYVVKPEEVDNGSAETMTKEEKRLQKRREYSRKHYREHNEIYKKYRDEHKEKQREYLKQYRAEHREELRLKQECRNRELAIKRRMQPGYVDKCYRGKVAQYSKEGELIKIYDSQADGARATGVDQSNIRRCIKDGNNRKTAGGFIWRKSD